MIIGILGSVLMIGVSIFSYLLAYPGSIAQMGAMATGAIGLLCLLGSGLAMGHPRAGGAILLLCGVPLLLMSPTALNLLIVAPVIIAGVLALMSPAATPEPKAASRYR